MKPRFLQISEQLAAMKHGKDSNQHTSEYGGRPLYKMLGYFSIIGLLRVHCRSETSLWLFALGNSRQFQRVTALLPAAHVSRYHAQLEVTS